MINRPIRTEAEYKAALVEIEKYFADEPKIRPKPIVSTCLRC